MNETTTIRVKIHVELAESDIDELKASIYKKL